MSPPVSAASQRQPYASDPAASRGRLHPEPEDGTRSPFQRDRDRVIHSEAFRRLKYKTQVFVYHEGDFFRTRLTHTLEVAQIARSISRFMGLDEDLAEGISLAHDLGHTPFGHAGEDALNPCMREYGGFNHNDNTLRILTSLERRYADFDGLNLTWETLEGVVKHNGPLLPLGEGESLPYHTARFRQQWDLEIDTWPSLEAQIAALSDDIAYNNHDLDDGLRAGLFDFGDLRGMPVVGEIVDEVSARYPILEPSRRAHEIIRRLINRMVLDLITESQSRINALNPQSLDDVRKAGRPLIGFSDTMREGDKVLRGFLMERMYRHFRVNRMVSKAKRIVRQLFDLFMDEPQCLPDEWRRMAEKAENEADARKKLASRARVVADYIASMTDAFAMDEHQRLFDAYSRTWKSPE